MSRAEVRDVEHPIAPGDPLARVLFEELVKWPIFDPHSHINPHRPAARDLDEILGYHYYTELAHSSGMPASMVGPEVAKADRIANLAGYLDRIDNTVQYSWLVEIAAIFHDHRGPIGPETVDALASKAALAGEDPDWDTRVWDRSNLERVLLTNEFDDPLEGWDRSKYVPCLRVDDLVLKLHHPSTGDRLREATNIDVRDEKSLRLAVAAIFAHFAARGVRACAVSLPPDFVPLPGAPKRAVTPVRRALAGLDLRPDEIDEVRRYAFWTIAEFCAEFRLPFDLMIGPIREAYPSGVAGGRDLLDRRVSLADYAGLFRHFAGVTFPVSTLAPDAAAELVAYSWIFPNVVPNGHWWYSNVPTFIADDLRARLQAVPKVKQIGYYSDAYKLEFVLPKFNTYRRVLAEVLADDAIRGRGWTEDQAIDLARTILLENPRRLFPDPSSSESA